jgi:hypothetical protein
MTTLLLAAILLLLVLWFFAWLIGRKAVFVIVVLVAAAVAVQQIVERFNTRPRSAVSTEAATPRRPAAPTEAVVKEVCDADRARISTCQ